MAAVVLFISLLYGASIATADVISELNDKKCPYNKNQNLDVSQTMGYFYDFRNVENLNGTLKTIVKSINDLPDLDRTRRLLVFVPGFTTYAFGETDQWTLEAFKNIPKTNLIIISYSHYIKDPFNVTNYIDSVNYAYYIGKAVGEFLAELHEHCYPARNMHLIGHSLGGQIINYVGETFLEITGEKLWRLTGLDAARPCFEENPIEDQLHAGTAEYVEAYHCSAYASRNVLADVEFYVNPEIEAQPGCEGGKVFPEDGQTNELDCSHYMCLINWLESVNEPNLYRACNSYEDYLDGCEYSQRTVAGYYNPGNATGRYYASTRFHKRDLNIFVYIASEAQNYVEV